MSIFSSLLAKLEGFTEAEWLYIHDNILPILEADAKQLIIQLTPLAEQAVITIATQGKVSNEARNAAVADLKTAATSAGIAAATGVLDYTVQTAYNKLSATNALPAAPSTPATLTSVA